uniref:Uncharacterized protein n=1 Tax=Oryza brachyantha TaxID=4533 RepID=J3LWP8_ORYBR
MACFLYSNFINSVSILVEFLNCSSCTICYAVNCCEKKLSFFEYISNLIHPIGWWM